MSNMWFISEFISVLCLVLYWNRKHGLNCHRMKPALFSVLCEIKEKTGKTFVYRNTPISTQRKNNTGASMHIEHRDFDFYFHLPLTRWQPASRLQGTSVQINQSRFKKKQQHVIVAHRNSQRFLFHWRCVCRSIFPGTALLGFKQKVRCSLHPHQPGTEQDGEIP